MSDMIMRIATDLLLVRDVLAADRGDTYEIPACAAVPDLDAAIGALSDRATLERPPLAPTSRPALPILVGRLRASRAMLERTVMLAPGPLEAFAAGSALRPLGNAVSTLAMAAVITDQRAIDSRSVGLHAIADQLQSVLDQIDAIAWDKSTGRDQSMAATIAGCEVQGAIERLRVQAGDAPADLRQAVVEWEAINPAPSTRADRAA